MEEPYGLTVLISCNPWANCGVSFGSLSCFYCFHSQVLPMPTDIKSFGNCSSLSLVFVSLRLFLLFSHCGRYDQRRWNRSDQIVNGTCWTVEGRSLHSRHRKVPVSAERQTMSDVSDMEKRIIICRSLDSLAAIIIC